MLYYRITITFDRPPDFSKRGWREALRGAMRAAAEHWHAAIMPRHFERSARGRYGYQPRTAKYQRRKMFSGAARSGLDLVYSGRARESAMRRPLIRAYPTRARLDLLVPPYIKMKPDPRGRRKAAPAMGDEMTRVTFEEAEELAAAAADFLRGVLAATPVAATAFSARKKVSVRTTASARSFSSADWAQSYTVVCE